jgi:RNA ligase
MKYDLNILNDYIDMGLVVKQNHPTHPLSIYNYSRTCQYDNIWDPVTTQCRGLVLDNEGNVIAKSFPKFFNLEQHVPDEIPNEPFEVFEKMDGSLGIAFHYKGDWIMATKGSFTSEQAVRGTQMLKNLSILRNYPTTGLRENWTYLFEIIYPENRIVCDYDFEDLVLLGAYDRDTLEEIDYDTLVKSVSLYPDVMVVRKYNAVTDYTKLKDMISDDREGYVIRFKGGMRMKIKGTEYLRLHRILTNFSTTMIWEVLSTGGDIHQYLDNVPDEFDEWVKNVVKELKYAYFQISERAGKLHDHFRYGKYNDVDPEPTKKEFAEFVMKQEPSLRPILFAMWDKKPFDHIIWKYLKPKWSKPFKENLDN